MYLGDGTILADIGNNLWAHFDSDGTQIPHGYYSRTLNSLTTGGTSVGLGGGTGGVDIQFEFTGPEGTYTMTRVPYGEPEILVEGSN